MSEKSVKQFMTPTPYTVGTQQNIAIAKKLMHDFNIRHLPVLSQNQLVGIVTDRDIRFAESIKDFNPSNLLIEEIYTPEPYQVGPEHDIVDVCEKLAQDKIGCAVVVEHQKVVGIFTWIDALKNIKKIIQ